MSLSIGKRDIQAIMAVLEPEYRELDDDSYQALSEAALRVLEAAWQRYEEKGDWTVVGQLHHADGTYFDPDDKAADKIGLGLYGTEKRATEVARSLTHSTSTNEDFRVWVLPVHHGTPATWFTMRREARKEKEKRNQPWYREEGVA